MQPTVSCVDVSACVDEDMEATSRLGLCSFVEGSCLCKTDCTYTDLRVARGSNIFFQIMVTFLSYISNACHSLSGVAERLQHTLI